MLSPAVASGLGIASDVGSGMIDGDVPCVAVGVCGGLVVVAGAFVRHPVKSARAKTAAIIYDIDFFMVLILPFWSIYHMAYYEPSDAILLFFIFYALRYCFPVKSW